MYQPTLGRFLSRDPLSENGVDVLTDTGFYSDRLAAMSAKPWSYSGIWTQPYVYARNNPTRYVDPSGELTVTPLQSNLSPACGGVSYIAWDFRLTQKKHCAGYFVQQVEMRCNVNACEKKNDGTFNCPNTSPVKPTITFWEAFYVAEDQPLYILRQVNQTDYTDASKFSVPKNTCGTLSAVGTIRFYCLKSTGDLGLPGIPAPNSGWKVGAKYQVGNCVGDAGPMPSTDDPKLAGKFWGKERVIESAGRSASVYWRCCGQCDFVFGSANPE
jgi:RHS repeat-associated protein